ncbi:alpha/beta hydrolase [Sphingomonas glaciei]|uniref:Alpha/beta hydrolase-fold protein n=1 Tax=Sphingomonas glaciei TaxID=2938948 RepID=A0ABY5MS92_9SPHN|nr:alpha/beta hydrolase-fold protein [Sphingomonas glaciei]UUR06983.1 alpha/beta hydrolase-fold protein [Sphingomonas glaciei]
MKVPLAALLLATPAALQAQAPAAATPITIGVSRTLQSRALGEQRTINVVLPVSYAKAANRRFPVIYLLDGGVDQDLLHVAGVVQLGSISGRMDDAIVVGIETKDRRRELVGKTQDPELLRKYPAAGSSGAFRAFVRDEVKPLIEAQYRTAGKGVVIGESLAGLFVVETYMVEPTLFDGYAAIDPSLWWDKQALSRRAAIIGTAQRGKRLYVALAKEQLEEPAAANRVAAAARAAGTDLCVAPRLDQTHATIYHQVEAQALQFLLPPGQAASPEFGFEVHCGPAPVKAN